MAGLRPAVWAGARYERQSLLLESRASRPRATPCARARAQYGWFHLGCPIRDAREHRRGRNSTETPSPERWPNRSLRAFQVLFIVATTDRPPCATSTPRAGDGLARRLLSSAKTSDARSSASRGALVPEGVAVLVAVCVVVDKFKSSTPPPNIVLRHMNSSHASSGIRSSRPARNAFRRPSEIKFRMWRSEQPHSSANVAGVKTRNMHHSTPGEHNADPPAGVSLGSVIPKFGMVVGAR